MKWLGMPKILTLLSRIRSARKKIFDARIDEQSKVEKADQTSDGEELSPYEARLAREVSINNIAQGVMALLWFLGVPTLWLLYPYTDFFIIAIVIFVSVFIVAMYGMWCV